MASEKLNFLFSSAAVFVLKLAFVAFPCLKWCFNKALIGHLQFVLSVPAFSWASVLFSFLHQVFGWLLQCGWCKFILWLYLSESSQFKRIHLQSTRQAVCMWIVMACLEPARAWKLFQPHVGAWTVKHVFYLFTTGLTRSGGKACSHFWIPE